MDVDGRKKRKHCFSKQWLTDDRYSAWIREVPGNQGLFYCVFCDDTYVCSSSHVLRHFNSVSHKKRLDQEKNSHTQKRTFSHKWLEVDSFKSWLEEVPGDPFSCFCKICVTKFSAGLSQINRHQKTASHVEKLAKSSTPQDANAGECLEKSEDIPLPFDERKASAEIRFAALIAEHNIPFDKADVILNFFKNVGKDPHVLQSMTMSRKKCTKVVSNVLAPSVTAQTVDVLRNAKFSIFIDETSDITNDKWMTFLVRYVDPQTLDIRTELVELIHLDAEDCSADKLIEAFRAEMWKREIPFGNIVALSCDNASVMLGKKSSFKTKLEKLCGGKLLTFPCPCHLSALIANAACAIIPSFCEEFIRKIPTFICNSPKRAAIFKSFQQCFSESNRKIARLCETRWLSRQHCVATILDNWDALIRYLQELVVSDKVKSAEELLQLMQNPDLKAYLLFLSYILNFFNRFNAFFQASETRIHLLQPESLKFLQNILQNFLKTPLLKFMDQIRCISFETPSNIRDLSEINFGDDCNDYLRELTKTEKPEFIETIKSNCLRFYIRAAEEIRNRLPIDDKFLSKLCVFEARIALFDSNRSTSFHEVLFVAQKIGGFDEIGLKIEWEQLYLDFSHEEKQKLSACSFDVMWKMILAEPLKEGVKYPHLRSLLSAVRSLPHSNADSERSFSMLPDVKTKKRNKLSVTSVNSICVTKTALKARGETSQTMKVSNSHLALMASENLYMKAPASKQSCLQLFAADLDTDDSSS